MRWPVKYVLEVRHNTQVVRAISLPPVSSASERLPFAQAVTYTLGARPVREHSINRSREIVLSGRSGFAPRSGQDRRGQPVTATGMALLREFEGFLQDWQRDAAEHGAQYLAQSKGFRGLRDRYQLVLHALDEDLHLLVEIVSWEPMRDADTSRIGYTWRLTLQAYGEASYTAPADPRGTATSATVSQTATTCEAALSDVEAFAARGHGILAAALAPGAAAGSIAAALTRASACAVELRRQIQAGIDLARMPLLLLAQTYQAYAALGIELERAADVLTGTVAATARRMQRSADAAATAALTAYGIARGGDSTLRVSALPPGGTSPIAPRDAGPVRVYQVQPADTLWSIAAAKLGDGQLWNTIAKLNGMLDANTLPTGAPLAPGVALAIPSAAGGEATAPAFGRDLYVDPVSGDLAPTAGGGVVYIGGLPTLLAGPATDYRLVVEQAGLLQALRRRLLCPLGAMRHFPAYGLPAQIGAPLAAARAGLVYAATYEQLRRESRISEVRSVVVADEGDTLVVEVQVVSAAGTELLVSAPVGA